MFTVAEREGLRESLLEMARGDERIVGAAITGSASRGAEDRWSDLDLAFGVAETASVREALNDWTDLMYRDRGALHHVDVTLGATVYRVFILRNTLQVDLAFSPASEFGALAPTFLLRFGSPVERPQIRPPAPEHLVGLAWLHALHARSSIERERVWQAEYMISAMRDHALALACLRHGLPAREGRGLDQLPVADAGAFKAGLVRSLDRAELARAFRAATETLLLEIQHLDPGLAARLAEPLGELTHSSRT